MTQALNLANFANNLNTSGATSNAGLQNSSINVTAGTGLSGGGAVSLGGSVSLANAGVTSIVAGTGISISGATGAVTINSSGGGVTSLNGQTGAVTTTTLYDIGMTIAGRPQNLTDYSVGSTIAGSSLYTTPLWEGTYFPAAGGWYIGGVPAQSATLINTGSWRCITRCYADTNYGHSGLWVRYA